MPQHDRMARVPASGSLELTGIASRVVQWTIMGYDATWLFLSLVPGGVGFVLFVYGKKQQRWPQLAAGLAMMVYPYFTTTVTALLAGGVLIAASLWFALSRGY